MICQECKERPATLHFTKVVNGEKTTIQLCERCAQEKGELFMNEGTGAFSFNDLLAGLLNFDSAVKQAKPNTSPPDSILQCDVCKMTYQQFIKVGRFGCAHCYETFREQLTPILKRLHTGNIEHGGKLPKRMGGSLHIKKQVQKLKAELQSLIANEEFEQAAKIRDQIRSLEKKYQDEEGNQG